MSDCWNWSCGVVSVRRGAEPGDSRSEFVRLLALGALSLSVDVKGGFRRVFVVKGWKHVERRSKGECGIEPWTFVQKVSRWSYRACCRITIEVLERFGVLGEFVAKQKWIVRRYILYSSGFQHCGFKLSLIFRFILDAVLDEWSMGSI
ncbi:hypothetical protein Droror1_Dr00007133 [Drosera rotundifolia]